jgi:putative tryptophan/tyrosine transport system substrate-binding protein
LNRRDFIAGVCGLATLPQVAAAQQEAVPVIGLLGISPKFDAPYIDAFRRGLFETGYIEGRNVAFEYRTAEYHYDQLPALANELVRRRVSVIAAIATTPAALAAKAATGTIPIVFMIGADPLQLGLVASLNQPGANVTGVSFLNRLIVAKHLTCFRKRYRRPP